MDVVKALKAGLELEKKGESFYSEAAEKVKNPHGKLTLKFLAREEKEHYKFLQGLLDSAEKGGPRGRAGLPKHPRLKKDEILEKMRRMGVKGEAPEGNKEIIEKAMTIEKKSIEFYEGCSSNANANDRKIFKTLVEEERKHLEWLEFVYEALEVHGYWYDLESYFALEG